MLEDNTYPVIERSEFFGDDTKIHLDFADPDYHYVGLMTIVLTAKLPSDTTQDLEF